VIEDFSRYDLRDDEHVRETKASANVKNRGAYFFTVLRDLLGMAEDEAGPRPPMQRRPPPAAMSGR
jgi:hypothetical protein